MEINSINQSKKYTEWLENQLTDIMKTPNDRFMEQNFSMDIH